MSIWGLDQNDGKAGREIGGNSSRSVQMNMFSKELLIVSSHAHRNPIKPAIKTTQSCSRIDILGKNFGVENLTEKPSLTHWQKEGILFRMNYKLLLLTLIWQYVHSVATNVAYYLHVQRPPLTDLGFDLLPALSKNFQIISEIMFFICVFLTIGFLVSPFFYPRRNLYFVLMFTRFAGTLVLAQTLRIVCFLVTTLPGPNYHCRPDSPDYAPPKTLMDIFGRQDAFFGCGDLVFSSHTIFVVLCALVWHKYCPFKWVRRVVWLLVFFFGLLVVAARKHYSLDIMVAWYTVPLIWIAYDHYFPDKLPVDFDPYPELPQKFRVDRKFKV